MKKADFRALIIIWIAAFLLSVGTSALFYSGIFSEVQSNPTEEMATTSWIQAPATDIAGEVHWNWAWTVGVIFPFLFGPLLVLMYAIVRFNKKRNPEAAKFHENVPLEVFWTIIPAVFLVSMAIPAYGVLQKMDYPDKKPDVVVDVTGHQFYWQYDFPRYGVTMTDDGTGDSPLVLPIDQVVMLNGQSNQVNHAWWVPAFGIKFDVIPGRTNYGWFTTEREGFFKGQCAELCGALHAYMLIHVKVVPEKEFYEWLHENGADFPVEDRDKVASHLGQDTAEEIYGEVPAVE